MTVLSPLTSGIHCPVPRTDRDRVELGHGSGGKMSAALLRECFLPHFSDPVLSELGDGAVVTLKRDRMVISTDTFVVRPLEFPGGDIGTLAVHGTINDVAMMGAEPKYLTAGFILEEGLPLATLDRIVRSMSAAATNSGVPLVTGDTKVVERGKVDEMFINTTGVGLLGTEFQPAPQRARAGDAVIISGPIGLHGIAVMAKREGLEFETEVVSDTAALHRLVGALKHTVGPAVHTLRDPTRGGLASALNEIAQAANVGVEIDEECLPIPAPVFAACEMLGFDPLYVANEGMLVAFVEERSARDALDVLRRDPIGRDAVRIGTAVADHPGIVALKTAVGGSRVVDMLPGDQLPRIC